MEGTDKVYAARIDELGNEAQAAQREVRRLANARLVVFAVVLLLLIFARATPFLFWPLLLAMAGLFVVLVVRMRSARDRLFVVNGRVELCRTGVARWHRDWDLVPVVLHDTGDAGHPYARDLDFFGRPAVTQLLGPVSTLHGKRILRSWLLAPATPEVIAARQQAVRVLAPQIEFREELAIAAGLTLGRGQQRLDNFFSFIADTAIPAPSFLARWFARLVPVATITLLVAHVSGYVDRAWWLLPLGASTVFCGLTLRAIYRTFDAAFSRDPAALAYSRAFRVAQTVTTDTPLLAQLKQQFYTGEISAAERIRQLERIMLLADVRHSGSASVLLDLFFQWSFHVHSALRAWQNAARSDLVSWFEALGELEALCSLATLAHDQPDWCYPHIDPAAPTISATQIGHPMLDNTRRVTNDVVIGPPGTFLFVTGSTLSGNSTLLRSIGVNTVLAQAGASVCAREMVLPPLRLYTSINVRDSLADGVSLYMAQLRRIKLILDAAEAQEGLICYLLDEILSGTNSTDRTTAVSAIVHQLLDQHTIGALATHDLALADDERIRSAGQAIHFREGFDEQGEMTFDYRIRPGVVQTSNALALMRMMGIK